MNTAYFAQRKPEFIEVFVYVASEYQGSIFFDLSGELFEVSDGFRAIDGVTMAHYIIGAANQLKKLDR